MSQTVKNCKACCHSYCEPDADYIVCGHPDGGLFGAYIHRASGESGHCGPERPKFEQHPLRTAEGSLKSGGGAA